MITVTVAIRVRWQFRGMGKFWNLLKKLGGASASFAASPTGAGIIKGLLPAVGGAAMAGGLVNLALNAILRAEGRFGANKGAEKREYAGDLIAFGAPAAIALIEQSTGADYDDNEEGAAALQNFIDALVRLLNCFRRPDGSKLLSLPAK
jgi:hypothetical protein